MHPDALAARLACILLGYLFGSFLHGRSCRPRCFRQKRAAAWHRQPRHG